MHVLNGSLLMENYINRTSRVVLIMIDKMDKTCSIVIGYNVSLENDMF